MKKIYYLLIICLATASIRSYGQTVLAYQDFEGLGGWGYTAIPATPIDTDITWETVSSLSSLTPTSGTYFWGLNNPTSDNSGKNYELDFNSVDVSSYTDVTLSFDYTYETLITDEAPDVFYLVYVDGAYAAYAALDVSATSGGSTITYNVDDSASSVYIEIYIDYDYTFPFNPSESTNFNLGLDNFEVTTTAAFDGLTYQNDTDGWLDGDEPNSTTSDKSILIEGGTWTITGDVAVKNITTSVGAGIDISLTGSLTVDNLLTENNLTIESDSDTYGSLIVNSSITGDITYNRHVADATTMDFISTPVVGCAFSEFATDNSNLAENASNSNVKRFGPFSKTNGVYENWSLTTNANDELESGIGYLTASTDDGTFAFTGTVTTDDVSVPVSHNSTTAASQWNLIGNPYPSYLSMYDFLDENDEDGANGADIFQTEKYAIYGYDGNASDGWLVYNKANTLGDAILMTPGQGFYIAVDDGLNGTMTFKPSMRRTGSTDDFIAGRTATYNKSNFTLSMSKDDTTYHTNEIYFFDDIVTLGLDRGFDTAIFGNNASGYTMYTQLVETNSSSKMAIQSLPNNAITEEGVTIALGIIAPANQQITLNIKETTLADNVEVYLEDKEENTSTLLTDEAYTFTTDTALSGTGRFYLNVSQNETLSIDENTIESLKFYTGNKTINIKGSLEANTKLTVYDIQGRQINNIVISNTVNEYTINTTGYSSGIYIVRIENQTGNQITKRVILK